MRNEIYYIFAPDNVFLPKDLFFIVLEFANLAQIGSRMLCFTVFFPHLVKRKNVKVVMREYRRNKKGGLSGAMRRARRTYKKKKK